MVLVIKNLLANAGNMRAGFNPWLGRSPRGGHGTPLQYPCLENPKDRGAWRAAVHGVTESWTRLSDLARMHADEENEEAALPVEHNTGYATSLNRKPRILRGVLREKWEITIFFTSFFIFPTFCEGFALIFKF